MREFTPNLVQDGKRPLYEQLVQYVIDQICAGLLPEGEKLPSKRALCAHLGVSMSTVENAYAVLEAEGYIEGRARSGYYACAYLPPVQPEPSAPSEPNQKPEPQPASYFSTADVDTSVFPYTIWTKLYRQVVQDGESLLKRGHPQGDIELRLALCDFLHQYRGVNCDPERIVVGAGFEYLMGLLIPLLGRDAVYALEDPGYGAVYRALKSGDAPHVPIALDARGMRVDELQNSGAKVAYVTPSHQFPTGITMSAGRRAQLLAWANAAPDRYLIEDDYDSEFRHLTRPISAMQGMDGERVIYVGTFNRSIAPSIRMAYLVLPAQLMRKYQQMFGSVAVTVSRFEQQALARFLSGGHYARHLRRMAVIYRRRHDHLIKRMAEIDHVQLSGHEAGLHFLLHHEHWNEQQLIDRAQQQGIALHALSEYRHIHPTPSGTLVIGYGALPDAKLDTLVDQLALAWSLN